MLMGDQHEEFSVLCALIILTTIIVIYAPRLCGSCSR